VFFSFYHKPPYVAKIFPIIYIRLTYILGSEKAAATTYGNPKKKLYFALKKCDFGEKSY